MREKTEEFNGLTITENKGLLFGGKYWQVWEYDGGGIEVISYFNSNGKIIRVYNGDASN